MRYGKLSKSCRITWFCGPTSRCLRISRASRAAEREAKSLTPATRPSLLALAFSQIWRGLVSEAKQTYEKLAMTDARGLSLVASGVGDALVYEGRFSTRLRPSSGVRLRISR